VKNLRRAAIIFFGIFFISVSVIAVAAPGVTVRAEVDKKTVTIGDKIHFTVTVSAPKGVEVEFPEAKKKIGEFLVKDYDFSKKTFFGKNTFTGSYTMDTLNPARHAIPELKIKYRESGENEWKELGTEEISVEVESVLAKYPDESDIRDIKGPLGLPGRYRFLIYVLAGCLAALLAAAAFTYIIKRRAAKAAEKVSLLPHELAYERLRALKAKDLPGKGKIEEYYVELSNIARCYLEERFELRAPEMTTEEFMEGLKEEEKLSRAHKALLKEFLFHCDLVKFAKYGPSPNEMDLSFKSAEKLVDQTKEI